MDPPADQKTNTKPEKMEEGKEGGPSFHCDLYDNEVAHKIAQEFIPGLATACVDNTTGGVFKNPVTVAVEMRREMVEYLTKRSESFVAESVILTNDPQAEISDHPCDIVRRFIDDFTSSKRNWLSRVSGWLLSEKREDKIDDFQQQMEKNEFWSMEKREPISQTLLKNVDLKNKYHCNEKFNSAEELAEHVQNCGFRIVDCTNVGCMTKIIAAHMENHDEACPYKILPCEQKCPVSIMRRDMDKHCITDCPMKIVNCPFYSVGCQAAIPHCKTEEHRLEDLRSHLVFVLQGIYKEASTEDLKKRAEQVEEISSPRELAESENARSLTQVVKKLDAKLAPFEVSNKNKDGEKAGSADKDSTADKGSEEVDVAAKAIENAGKENEEANAAANKVSEEVISDANKAKEVSDASMAGEVSDASKAREVTSNASEAGKEVSEASKASEEVSDPNKASEEVRDASKASEEVKDASKASEGVNEANKASEGVSASKSSEEVKDGSKAREEVKDASKASEGVSEANKASEEVSEANKASEEVKDASKANEEVNETNKASEEAKDATKVSEEGDAPSKASEEASATNKVVEDINNGNKTTEEVSSADKVSDEVNATKEASAEVSADKVNEEGSTKEVKVT